jgi:hypothetical protein
MKVRHAAALVLLPLVASCAELVRQRTLTGWQIMLPPGFDETAPLSKWSVDPWETDLYQTEDQCEQKLNHERDTARRLGVPQLSDLESKWRCVSTDDPRLKPN